MSKSKFILLFIAFGMLALSSCKKEDPKQDNDSLLKIEGTWQLAMMDFLDDRANWDKTVEFSFGNYFGFAPAMFADMQGFDFATTKSSGGQGNIFNYINEGEYNQGKETFWYWNYTNNKKAFEIIQINKEMPPYDFTIKNISDIEILDNGNKITFMTKVSSRLSGQPMTTTVQLPVKITLIKANPTQNVEIYVQGKKQEYWTQGGDDSLSLIDKIREKVWKLKPGSDLYDPSMDDEDNPAKGYMKIMVMQLDNNDILNYRYAYPMGIVSPKQHSQTELANNILEVKLGGSYGTPEKIFDFQVESVDNNTETLRLRVDGVIREFVKTDNMNNVDKNDYNLITE
ncbi:MAG: hypothetical protein J5I91_06865 [Bacteroidetes bacterium]|nr:hypothetical protein [Bacteroidota bacterium]